MNNKEKKVLAIIPARGGSKRLPGKNVKQLCGKPMIAWTIEAALECSIFDCVMVSTDCAEIAATSKECGASVPFLRGEELSSDTAKSIDVIQDVIGHYQRMGLNFTDVVLLQPTSPLRQVHSIKQAYQCYEAAEGNSVVSVCDFEHPIEWALTIEGGGCSAGFRRFSREKSGIFT